MGVIAQDVEAVSPQAVKSLNDGTKAVCYEMLVGLLIEGFKEQTNKISELEEQLNQCCTANNKVNRMLNSEENLVKQTNAQRSSLQQTKPV